MFETDGDIVVVAIVVDEDVIVVVVVDEEDVIVDGVENEGVKRDNKTKIEKPNPSSH